MVIWVIKIFFVQFFSVLFSLLLDLFGFCYILAIFVLYCAHLSMKCFLGVSSFLEEISSLSHSIVFLILCIVHLRRLSYRSLLFFGTLHSVGYIFPFLLCLSILIFSQRFVRPPQTTIFPFCISFLGDGFGLLCNAMNFHP